MQSICPDPVTTKMTFGPAREFVRRVSGPERLELGSF
jgi:hypothetical protein